MESLLTLSGPRSVPDFSTLSRRQNRLKGAIPYRCKERLYQTTRSEAYGQSVRQTGRRSPNPRRDPQPLYGSWHAGDYPHRVFVPKVLQGNLHVGFSPALTRKHMTLATEMGHASDLAAELYDTIAVELGPCTEVEAVGFYLQDESGTRYLPENPKL